jgi:uncharacterized small protein (DUF1192 family)
MRRADELETSGRLDAAAPLVEEIERRLAEVEVEIGRLLADANTKSTKDTKPLS